MKNERLAHQRVDSRAEDCLWLWGQSLGETGRSLEKVGLCRLALARLVISSLESRFLKVPTLTCPRTLVLSPPRDDCAL